MDIQKRIDEVQYKADILLNSTNVYTSLDVERIRNELITCRNEVMSYFAAEIEKNTAELTAARNELKKKEDNWNIEVPYKVAFGVCIVFLVVIIVVVIYAFVVTGEKVHLGELLGFSVGIMLYLVFLFFSVNMVVGFLIDHIFSPAPGTTAIRKVVSELDAKSKENAKQKEHANAEIAELDQRLQQELSRADARYFDKQTEISMNQIMSASSENGAVQEMVNQMVETVKKAIHQGWPKEQPSGTINLLCGFEENKVIYQVQTQGQARKDGVFHYAQIASAHEHYGLYKAMIAILQVYPLVGEDSAWRAEEQHTEISDFQKQGIVHNNSQNTLQTLSFTINYTGPNVNYQAPKSLFS